MKRKADQATVTVYSTVYVACNDKRDYYAFCGSYVNALTERSKSVSPLKLAGDDSLRPPR
jgi:hypothetical protein